MGNARFVGRVGALAVALGIGGAAMVVSGTAVAEPSTTSGVSADAPAESPDNDRATTDGTDATTDDSGTEDAYADDDDPRETAPADPADIDVEAESQDEPEDTEASRDRSNRRSQPDEDQDASEPEPAAPEGQTEEVVDEDPALETVQTVIDSAAAAGDSTASSVPAVPVDASSTEDLLSSERVSLPDGDVSQLSESDVDDPIGPLASPLLFGLLSWARRDDDTAVRRIAVTATVDGNNDLSAGAPVVGAPDPVTGIVTGSLNFAGAEGYPLTYEMTSAPARGSVTVSGDGTFSYTPTQAARLIAYRNSDARSDAFVVRAFDGSTYAESTVSVTVSPAKLILGQPVSISSQPVNSAFGPDGTRVYVTDPLEDRVAVFDASTNTVIDYIEIVETYGSAPQDVAVSPDGMRVYVTTARNSVWVVDASTNLALRPISLPDDAANIALSPDGTRAYVTGYSTNRVTVIDLEAESVVATIDGFNGPLHVEVGKDGTRAYVTNTVNGPGSVMVIDTSTNTVIETIRVGPTWSGFQPYSLSLSPDGSRLYTADLSHDNITVIDTADNTVIEFIDGPSQPTAVVVGPDGSLAYVVSQGDDTVSVIDLGSGRTIASYTFADHPNTLSVSPDGTRVYVMRTNEGLVSVLSLVEGVNSAPEAGALTIDSADQSTGVVRGTLNFSDPDGDVLTYTVTTNPAKGTLVVDADGTFVYTPDAAARHAAAADGASPSVTNDSFMVVASDGQASIAGSFGLTILSANAVPTAGGQVVIVPGISNTAWEFISSTDGTTMYVEYYDPDITAGHTTLAVIDVATNTVRKIPLAGVLDAFLNIGPPIPIVASRDGRYVYIAQKNPTSEEHFLSVVDIEAGTSTTVAFPRQAKLYISDDGRYVYGMSLDSVSIFDTATSSVTTTAVPYGVYKKLIVRPNSAGVVVADFNVLSILDNDGAVAFYSPSGSYDATPLVSPDGRHVYVTSRDGQRTGLYLGIVDTETGAFHEVVLNATEVKVGSDGRLYTITDGGTLTVLDREGHVVDSVALDGTYELIVMSSDGTRAIAHRAPGGSGGTGGPSLALVDLASLEVRTVSLDHIADFVEFSPDGRYAFVPSWNEQNNVSIVDFETAAVTAVSIDGYLDLTNYAFTSDGDHFSVAVYNATGDVTLVTVDIRTSTVTTLPLPPGFGGYAANFTSDGRKFYGLWLDESVMQEKVFSVAVPPQAATGVTVGAPAAVTGAVLGSVAYVDADGDVLRYFVDAAPTRGTVSIDQATGSFTYTPATRESAATTDVFTVLVDDGHGGRVPVTVTVPVAAMNDAPTVQLTAPGTPDVGTGAINLAVDAADANGDTLTYSFSAGKGSVTMNADGTYTYTPTAAARHAAASVTASPADREDTITVTVTDVEGLSATASVIVVVGPYNTAPRVGHLSSFQAVNSETGNTVGGAQWVDDDGDALTFTMSPTSVTKGDLVLRPSGSFEFTPTPAARHAAASSTATDADRFINVTLVADDGHGGTFSVSYEVAILPLNAEPVATATTRTPNGVGVVTGRVTATDADHDPLTYSVASAPTGGTVVIDSTGRFTYTPTAAARHAAAATDGTAQTQDTFTLAVADGYGGVASVPVTVQILPKNTVPAVSVIKNSPDPATSTTTGTLVASDADGDSLTYTVSSEPAKGSVVVDATGAFTYTPTAEARHAAAGAGAATADKRDAFTVTVADGHGGTRVVTVTTQVLPLNAKPTGTPVVATPDSATGVVTGSVGGADTDGDALTYTVTRAPTKGVVTLDADGQFVYTPTDAARHIASATTAGTAQKQDTFTVSVADAYGGKTAVVVTAAIAPANVGPSATAIIGSPAANGQVAGMVIGVDPDADVLKYQVTGAPAKGTVRIGSTGTFTYTPTAAARHAAASLTATEDDRQDTFTITVSDGHGGTTSVTLTAAIAPKNAAPTAGPTRSAPDASTGSVAGSLGAKDRDDDALTYVLTSGPTRGTVTVNTDGSYLYVPTQEARILAGSQTATTADKRDTFTITILDGYGGTKEVTITATIVGITV